MAKDTPSQIQDTELDQVNGGGASPDNQATTSILDLHNEVVSRPKKTQAGAAQSHGGNSVVCNYFPAGN